MLITSLHVDAAGLAGVANLLVAKKLVAADVQSGAGHFLLVVDDIDVGAWVATAGDLMFIHPGRFAFGGIFAGSDRNHIAIPIRHRVRPTGCAFTT